MDTEKINTAFHAFEAKYDLPPIFQLSDGKILSGFIITLKNGESAIIEFNSEEEDLQDTARLLSSDNIEKVMEDLKQLQFFCSPPASCVAPEQLH